jgi:hypothetical protein
MDNCVKDNKNCHLLAFLSLLTTREVFEEIQLGFFVVGHTHEDIDRSFGYLSKKLKEENNYVMAYLMKAFMFSQDRPFILQLIQEILDIKSWVNGYLNNGLDVLVSHTKMHLFWFFVDEVGWLVVQYKIFHIDVLWSPKDGPTIRLWKEDGIG